MPQPIPDHFDYIAARANADLRARGVEDLRFDTPAFRSRRALAEAAAALTTNAAPAPAPSEQQARKPAPARTTDPVSALRSRCRAALALPEASARPRQALALALAAPLDRDALRAILSTLPTDAAAGGVDFSAAGACEADPQGRAEAKRIASILTMPEVDGLEAHAVSLATLTGIGPDQVRAMVSLLPKETKVATIAERAAAEAEFGFGGGDDLAAGGRGASAADRAWQRAITGINAAVRP